MNEINSNSSRPHHNPIVPVDVPSGRSPLVLFLAITAVALVIFAIYALYKMRAAPAARSESRRPPSSNTALSTNPSQKIPRSGRYKTVDEPRKAPNDRERKWKKASYVHSWRTGLNKSGQTATDKMGKQLARALKTSWSEKNYYTAPFNVAAPQVAAQTTSSFTITKTLDTETMGGGECIGRRERNEDTSVFFSITHGKHSYVWHSVMDMGAWGRVRR